MLRFVDDGVGGQDGLQHRSVSVRKQKGRVVPDVFQRPLIFHLDRVQVPGMI
jgi:hypothetical protein